MNHLRCSRGGRHTHASPIDAVEINANLVSIAQTLDKVAHVGEETDDAR